jgi:hypothetical protein
MEANRSCHRPSSCARGELIWAFGDVSGHSDPRHVRKRRAISNVKLGITWTWRQKSPDRMARDERSATLRL